MILASASPRRLELLRHAGFQVSVHPADVDEKRLPDESPTHLVERLARLKAHATLEDLGGNLGKEVLLAADTIVWTDDGDVLGKPAGTEAACNTLRELSGRTHHVSTGACIVCASKSDAPMFAEPDSGERNQHTSRWACLGTDFTAKSFVETTDVAFYDLSDEQIRAYVSTGEPMDKAGSYGIQGLGRLLVRGIHGDYANVVGLPVARVVRELGSLLGTDAVSELLQGEAAKDAVADVAAATQRD